MIERRLHVALAATLALVLAASPAAHSQAGPGADAELPIVAKLEADRDQADGALLKQLAAFKTPSAAKELVGFYGKLASLWMKREVLRVLREFDGVVLAGNTALDHVATVAANVVEPELRDAAFDTLEHCPQTGRAYLAKIVELPVQQQVRERALELHAATAGKEDATWYRKLFEDEKLPHKLREKAFEALAKSLEPADLQKYFHDVRDGTIRRIVLEAMQRQKMPGVAELALETVKQVNVLPTDRAHAASVLVAVKGAKAADELIEVALQQATTPWQLRGAIADLLVTLNDPNVNKKLLAMVGLGKPHEQWFALLATRHLVTGDEKLLKKVRSTLDDKETEIRRVAIRIVGEQKDVGSAEPLEKQLKKPKDAGDAAPIILALSKIRAGGDKAPEWEKRLVEISKEEDRDRRNAALTALQEFTGGGDKNHVSLFVERLSHPDWTTRMLALQALEKLRDRDSVGAIIERMPKESGRLLLEFAGTLFRMTGEPHDDNAIVWKRWWDGGGKDAPLISPEELEKKIADREKKRLQQTTSAPRFFGVKIESHDVVFVVDISGSMAEQLETTKIDGKPATRLEVVKLELVKCLRGLDASALFNLITFSSGVTKWKEGVVALSDKTRAEAIEYVGHLGSRGGTDIYDALQAAFADPKVDTIFLLTDGEPSQGAVTDLQLIREHVARLNETRKVRIHCIGVGGDFPLLEWLSKDAEGTYVKFD